MLQTQASVAGGAGFNIQEGVAPTTPNDGDVWVTTAGAFNARLNGATVNLAAVSSVTVQTGTSYTAVADDIVMVDDDTAAATVTITLPAGTADDIITVKKLGTTANVIIDGNGTEEVDGALTHTLTTENESVTLVYTGATFDWRII